MTPIPGYIPVVDYSPVVNYAADTSDNIQQTGYILGVFFVGLATLIASVAGYKKIVNSMRLSSFEDLETEVKRQREDFKKVLNDRDKEHQEEMDKREREHQAEMSEVRRQLYLAELTTERYGRAIVASINHIRQQDRELADAGKPPIVIPIELVAIERDIQSQGATRND